MIKPTVGRVVWFAPPVSNQEHVIDPRQPFAALITFVWNDRLINVVYFDHIGCKFSATEVPLLQDDDLKPEFGNFAMWMPYQKGQAAKTEAAQAALKGVTGL